MVTDEEIEREFEEFSITIDDVGILDKLKEICSSCRLNASQLCEEWVAFSQALEDSDPTLATLEKFERKQTHEMNKRVQTQFTKIEANTKMHTKEDLDDLMSAEDDILDMYSTPANKGALKRAHTTPEMAVNKRHTSVSHTPGGVVPFSPASFSPAAATPSLKYGSRHNAGDVVCSTNPSSRQGTKWQGTGADIKVTYADEKIALHKNFKYMFQKQVDKENVLNEMIDEMAEKLKIQHGIEEYAHTTSPSQGEVTVVGRICCDAVGKLNASSVMLEGSQDQSQGRQVKLDLTKVQQFALFPGQVVAARGINSTGSKLVVNQLYEGVKLPFYASLDRNGENLSNSKDPFVVVVAAGPYTTSDSLMYEPLADLIRMVQKNKPDLLILLGPFVDSKHEKIENVDLDETFESLFKRQVDLITQATERQGTTVVFAPSQRDVHHDFVFPQPPFRKDTHAMDHKNIHFVSDPCTLLVGNVTIGLTSTDVLLNLGSEETACPPGSSDRLGRLVKHILHQHSFYPLNPPNEEVNVDYERLSHHGTLPCSPDLLVLPSDLRYFTKNILGSLCVNPGRLAKGQVGGTYARILIQPDSSHTDASVSHIISKSVAEVVRI
ncbi:predicted protein [Nematostella vectensis]|uniref:DNA polymerase alpha subunit B n=1 Tax=Nematostella vectensis TaxID=45351 RepID=A7S4W9_NEMVE|nr:predicted protein [Nematostella vectensis]|eukprot:XP_001633332.1 predicted protein [Nematostella vectensis]